MSDIAAPVSEKFLELEHDLLELALDIAQECAQIVRESTSEQLIEVATKSSGTDFVTEIDRQSDERLRQRLQSRRPLDSILTEEGQEISGSSGVRWVCDPLDGTTNFVHGLNHSAISIAAQFNGETIVGVVHDVFRDEVFSAGANLPASLNGTAICPSDATNLNTALIASGFGYDAAQRGAQAKLFSHLASQVGDLRRLGSAALDLCWVANGVFDGYFEHGLAPWDMAAGALIANRAGSRVVLKRSNGPSGHYLIASTPALFDNLEMLLDAHGADAV